MERMNRKVRKIMCYFVLAGLLLLTVIAASTGLTALNSRNCVFEIRPFGLVLGSLFLMLLFMQLLWLYRHVLERSEKRQAMLIRSCLFFGIFLLQIICLKCLGKITLTEDSFKVVDMASNMVHNTHGMIDNTTAEAVYGGYFARYSNNHVITIFFYYFFSALHFFGCNDFILAARVLNVILLDLGIVLSYLSARKLWGSKRADILLLFMALSPTTYVWLFWSYTNTFSIPFVMGILLLYLHGKECKSRKKTLLYGIGTGAVGIVGYFLRPTTIIPIIAVVIMQVLFSKSWKKTALWLVGFCLVVLVGTGSIRGICKTHLTDPSGQEAFPITHWIMIGLSETGGYNKQDVGYTSSYLTKEEKQQANIREIKKRIKRRNVVGMLDLMKEKLCRVYGDGEDNFTQQKKFSENQTALYDYMYGEKNAWFLFYCKVFRIFVLGCIVLWTVCLLRKGAGKTDDTFLYALTLFGSMLFFLIWEANNKYSISFEYVMLLLAGDAMCTLYEKISSRFFEAEKGNYKIAGCVVTKYRIYAICQIGITLLLFLSGWHHCVEEKGVCQHNVVDIQIERTVNSMEDVAEKGRVLGQTFMANTTFDHLELFISKKDISSDTIYKISILDEQKKTLVEEKISIKSKCVTRKKIALSFEKIVPEKKAQTYVVQIEPLSGKTDSIGYHFNQYLEEEKYEGGNLRIGNNDTKKDLCMRVYDEREESYLPKQWYIGIFVLLVLFEFFLLFSLKERLEV